MRESLSLVADIELVKFSFDCQHMGLEVIRAQSFASWSESQIVVQAARSKLEAHTLDVVSQTMESKHVSAGANHIGQTDVLPGSPSGQRDRTSA